MFNLIKYEYRKNLVSLAILGSVLVAIQLYFAYGILSESPVHTSIATVLFFLSAFACYMFVLISGIASFSSELKNKSGYLTFMTPNSNYKIVGSKLLTTFITGVALVMLLFLFFKLDYALLATKTDIESFREVMDSFMITFGYDTTHIVLGILVTVIVFIIQFFMVVTVAYVAIALSRTVLENKKAKGLISFIIFVVLYTAIQIIAVKLPRIDVNTNDFFMQQMISTLPTVILYLVIGIGSYISTVKMLDRQISL